MTATPGLARTGMIPVRVPADTMPTVLDEPHVLSPGHPATLLPCAACAELIGAVRPMVVVYVGTEPAQRRPGGAMRGTGVPVHAECAGIAPAADPPCTVCEHGRDQHHDGHCRMCGILRVNYPNHEYTAEPQES